MCQLYRMVLGSRGDTELVFAANGSCVDTTIVDSLAGEIDRFEQDLIRSLQRGEFYRELATEEQIERNRGLIALWDGMSLAMCHGIEDEVTFNDVPAAGQQFRQALESLAAHDHRRA
mgnify:CR=1 FL=1